MATGNATTTITFLTPVDEVVDELIESISPVQEVVDQPPAPDCNLCGFKAVNVRKLKTHLLLKHPDVHLCLFCVEKKGWSDNFASQSQYNQHYKDQHEGVIQSRLKGQGRGKADKSKVDEDQAARTKFRGIVCFLCSDKPLQSNGLVYDRHLISVHNYDYCKLCSLIGPLSTVRYHILEQHPTELCHFCCSKSPVFRGHVLLSTHLTHCHRHHGHYLCFDCEDKRDHTSASDLKGHLLQHHLTKGDALRPMRKKRCSEPDNEDETLSKVSKANLHVLGVTNESGQDCFAIAVLQVLAQTSLGTDMDTKCTTPCPFAGCLLSHFFKTYRNHKRGPISLGTLGKHYSSLGINELPIDAGDFLKAVLNSLNVTAQRLHLTSDLDPLTFCQVSLRWKFECRSCLRFMVMSMNDLVITIPAATPNSFQGLLDQYLGQKACGSCKVINKVTPELSLSKTGNYLFVELDRASHSEDDTKDIVLYSLQLEQDYQILGQTYRVFATVSYNLDDPDGGHYLTHLLDVEKPFCIRIHETDSRFVKKKPDFDADTVLVGLCKLSE